MHEWRTGELQTHIQLACHLARKTIECGWLLPQLWECSNCSVVEEADVRGDFLHGSRAGDSQWRHQTSTASASHFGDTDWNAHLIVSQSHSVGWPIWVTSFYMRGGASTYLLWPQPTTGQTDFARKRPNVIFNNHQQERLMVVKGHTCQLSLMASLEFHSMNCNCFEFFFLAPVNWLLTPQSVESSTQ